MPDAYTYHQIGTPGEGLYRESGSKFLAYTYRVSNETEAGTVLENLKKEHPKARHICFAWRIGFSEPIERASDDGEPAGSAGSPILGQLKSFDLHNSMIAVVRYFGGTKLGIPGLIKAYKTSALEALTNSVIKAVQLMHYYEIKTDYTSVSALEKSLDQCRVSITERNYGPHIRVLCSWPPAEAEHLLAQLENSLKNAGLLPGDPAVAGKYLIINKGIR